MDYYNNNQSYFNMNYLYLYSDIRFLIFNLNHNNTLLLSFDNLFYITYNE
jgi:hypothetical protein